MKIEINKVVDAEYELYVDGENGEPELMERATPEQPLNFIYGVGMMLPKFEENLNGLQKDDNFEFTIKNEDAYGEYDDDAVVELERAVFEIDGKLDEEMVFEGNIVPLMDNEGNRLQAQVVSVTDTHVTVDLNHPLAGETLHFKGKVLGVRDATEQELKSLLGGGCSCGDGGCGCGDDCDDNHGCGCGCN
ncbi:MAG TPA: peptidylprolyl isomerase [Paludibacteraceae bacterium]|nr:peptidylprolyl isomerase [Paludibacteraceae bacterium]HPT42786.1 peptidylprolyl isomerase [Paludibacteraceae bacterium]